MRTTLTIDDDVFAEIRRIAEERDEPLGQVVSGLVRQGLRSRRTFRVVDGLPTFEVPAGAPPITADDVMRLRDDA